MIAKYLGLIGDLGDVSICLRRSVLLLTGETFLVLESETRLVVGLWVKVFKMGLAGVVYDGFRLGDGVLKELFLLSDVCFC